MKNLTKFKLNDSWLLTVYDSAPWWVVKRGFENHFWNLLIIHHRKIVKVLGYLILIGIGFFTILFLRFLFSFFWLRRLIKHSRPWPHRVWPHSSTPRSSSKLLRCVPYFLIVFSILFSVFANVVKHGRSYLICYLNKERLPIKYPKGL